MLKHVVTWLNRGESKKQIIIFGCAALVLILIYSFFVQITKPPRTVTNYCKAYVQEKTRLELISNSNSSYPSGLFSVNVNDAGEIVQSLSRLQQVAPTEIEPSIKNLQTLYQQIHDDPSRAIEASLNGGFIDDSVRNWTAQHCR